MIAAAASIPTTGKNFPLEFFFSIPEEAGLVPELPSGIPAIVLLRTLLVRSFDPLYAAGGTYDADTPEASILRAHSSGVQS